MVDKAGQIGGRQMLELFGWREPNARVILSGDTRQHGAVEASDALLAIERYSGVKPVELHTIRRQDPALGRSKKESSKIKQYRKAVEVAAAGKLAECFNGWTKRGWWFPAGWASKPVSWPMNSPAGGSKRLPPSWYRKPGRKCIASIQRCVMGLKGRD